MLTGCTKKLVTIEYDQSMNFHDYSLAQPINTGYSNGTLEDKITAYDDSEENKPKGGFFLIYQICTISNNDSDAETFNFDLSKFYVVHNEKRYYHTPLQREQFKAGGNIIHYSVIDQWQSAFKYEIQTASDKKTIPAHLENILSVSWRFHIWIGDVVWLNEFETKRFDLRYDNSSGKESVLLLSRGHDPVYKKDAEKGDLPGSCRTAK
jgi:hypothetical protein